MRNRKKKRAISVRVLSPEQRETVEYFWAGYAVWEIAERVGLTEWGVRSRLRYAKERLEVASLHELMARRPR